MGQLSNLKYLYLFKNRFTGTLPPEMGALQKLQALAAGDCMLEGTLPPQYANMSSLWYLGTYNNALSGTLPPEYGRMQNLAMLCVPNRCSAARACVAAAVADTRSPSAATAWRRATACAARSRRSGPT